MKNLLLTLCVVAFQVGCSATEPAVAPDAVGEEFQAAQDSVEFLSDFIRTHPDRPTLCGAAQMRIGYLLAHSEKEKLPEAIRAYEKSIKDYGSLRYVNAAAAPIDAPVTIADSARLQIAVCYKKLGESEKARASYESITHAQLKAANRRHFVTKTDVTGIEQPSAGDVATRAAPDK
jgi:hypothetical protein